MKRREAKTLGLEKYTTGKPCKNGHLAERYTVNGTCVECSKKTYINADKELKRIMGLQYYHNNKEHINEKRKLKYKSKK